MSKKAYDVVVAVGEYQSQGETKTEWMNVGVIMKKDDGKPFLLLDRTFNPAGVPNPEDRKNVLLNLFVPKPKEEKPQTSDDGQGEI